MVPKTSAYAKGYDGQTEGMQFQIEHDDLLKKYNTFWDKLSTNTEIEFDSDPVFNETFLKTKIKSHGDDVTEFYDEEIPKMDSTHTCLTVISLDSALKNDENFIHIHLLKSVTIFKK